MRAPSRWQNPPQSVSGSAVPSWDRSIGPRQEGGLRGLDSCRMSAGSGGVPGPRHTPGATTVVPSMGVCPLIHWRPHSLGATWAAPALRSSGGAHMGRPLPSHNGTGQGSMGTPLPPSSKHSLADMPPVTGRGDYVMVRRRPRTMCHSVPLLRHPELSRKRLRPVSD